MPEAMNDRSRLIFAPLARWSSRIAFFAASLALIALILHRLTSFPTPVALNITNREADELTRRFAELAGVSLSEAVVIAMREAIERRRQSETVLQTAARLRQEFGITP